MTTEFEENRRNLFKPFSSYSLGNHPNDYIWYFGFKAYNSIQSKNRGLQPFYRLMLSLELGKNPDA